MPEKFKYTIDYLYNAYKKYYNRGDMEKADIYNSMADKLHGVNLDIIYHEKLNKKDDRLGPFGIGKYKKIKYG